MRLPIIFALGEGIGLAVLLIGLLVFALAVGVFAIVTRRKVIARICGVVVILHGLLALLPLFDEEEDGIVGGLFYALALFLIGTLFIWFRRKPKPSAAPMDFKRNA
jgi:hypothetical protein